jgi:hypothetical protein
LIDLNAVQPIGGMSGQRAPSFAETTTRLNERIEDVARALFEAFLRRAVDAFAMFDDAGGVL